jgi:signal transduction histidine kinase
MVAHRKGLGFMIRGALPCLLLASLQTTLHAAPPKSFSIFEKAEFVLSDERRPPGNAAGWEPVALPDQWRQRMPDGVRTLGWYRIRFDFTPNPSTAYNVGITHPRAFRTDFFVNGRLVGGAGDLIAGSRAAPRTEAGPAFGTPLYVTVAPGLLRTGENVIHARVNATSAGTYMHGLPQVRFGEAGQLRRSYQLINETGFGAQRTFFAMALTCGLITFFLWLARREDKVMFWYSMACLMWGIVSIPRLALRWVDFFQPVVPVLSWFLNYGLVVPVVILCLRTINLKWPRFEGGLWVFLVIEATFPLWGTPGKWGHVWDVANTALLLTGVVTIVRHTERPFRWSVVAQIAALLLMAGLMFFEVARYLGWLDIDLKAVRHYHVPLMLLAIGALIFERHVLAVRRTEQANVELEHAVMERTREIEANYGRMEEAARTQALARQRQRILADLHDGLGASLMGLLQRVQTGPGEHAGIEARVREALIEMKVAVDALKPHEGDLNSVLGNLRQRLNEMIQTGLRLVWEVEELPPVTGLRPTTVFELQRIVLEAITNVLKHSGASEIRFSAHASTDSRIEIRISDNGHGFDSSLATVGLGLANMRTRALRIGATLDIRRPPYGGTVVNLTLPIAMTASLLEDELSAWTEENVKAA